MRSISARISSHMTQGISLEFKVPYGFIVFGAVKWIDLTSKSVLKEIILKFFEMLVLILTS